MADPLQARRVEAREAFQWVMTPFIIICIFRFFFGSLLILNLSYK